MFDLATVLTIHADHAENRCHGDDIENRCHGVKIYLYLLIYFFILSFLRVWKVTCMGRFRPVKTWTSYTRFLTVKEVTTETRWTLTLVTFMAKKSIIMEKKTWPTIMNLLTNFATSSTSDIFWLFLYVGLWS